MKRGLNAWSVTLLCTSAILIGSVVADVPTNVSFWLTVSGLIVIVAGFVSTTIDYRDTRRELARRIAELTDEERAEWDKIVAETSRRGRRSQKKDRSSDEV